MKTNNYHFPIMYQSQAFLISPRKYLPYPLRLFNSNDRITKISQHLNCFLMACLLVHWFLSKIEPIERRQMFTTQPLSSFVAACSNVEGIHHLEILNLLFCMQTKKAHINIEYHNCQNLFYYIFRLHCWIQGVGKKSCKKTIVDWQYQFTQ